MIHPLELGSLTLPTNVICAPLAGCTNLTWRRMLKRFSPGLMFCEMVKMEALVRADANTSRILDYDADMHPIGAQICGSNIQMAATAAKMIEELGFDVIDLNCGCPVDKVTKDGSGSGLLKYPERIGEILYQMVQAVSIPVTVKIRAGWDDEIINAPEIVEIAEQAGAKAIAIHGRTRAQGYKGSANRAWIKDCKARANTIKIYGNGDVFDPESAAAMFEETGCDGILLARGTLGRPWIIEDITRALSGLPAILRTSDHYRSILLEHLNDIESYHNERKALIEMRKIGCWYLKKSVGTKALRDALNKAQCIQEARAVIESYDWDQTSFAAQEELTFC
ncbi:MAG TPA: tRNA dihydrouridine synthase DusB [Chlamydiales bacterium]|nr:tRNA dihydrouridine synthase DusB [Chlamydiales bacterium]HPE84810.1 tRNA dihydrouridine synthase DusB [Chlamydiales bacterium]